MAMASSSSGRLAMAMICTLLLFPTMTFSSAVLAHSGQQADQKQQNVDVAVEGIVYCQSCKHYGSRSLTGADPIPSARVSVICKNYQNQVSYYKSFETDVKGYFYAQLNGYKVSHTLSDHPLQACHVKLLSSPLANCSLLSNVNYGINGAPLRYESKILRGGSNSKPVIYAAGPLAFRPAQCPPAATPHV